MNHGLSHSVLSLFKGITHSLSFSLGEIKLNSIVKYGLILLRFSSFDSVLFLSLLSTYPLKLIVQKLPPLTGF